MVLDLPSESDQESSGVMDDKAAESSVRTSSREKHQTKFYGIEISHLSFQNEPVTYEEETASSDSLKWIKAMESQMKSLSDSDVWDIIPLTTGKKAVGSKLVYKIKTGADGNIERYKARLVAQGFTQADHDETFSPVVKIESFRVLIALSVQYGFQLRHVDVKTTFLNGDLEEEVYMKQPKVFATEGKYFVCKLN